MFLSEWREFPSAPCLAGKKELDDSSRLDVVEIALVPDMFRDCFLPGRAKDLSAPWYYPRWVALKRGKSYRNLFSVCLVKTTI